MYKNLIIDFFNASFDRTTIDTSEVLQNYPFLLLLMKNKFEIYLPEEV